MTIVVVEVIQDMARGMSVEVRGRFTDPSEAERYRRRCLARNVDRYPHPPQRPRIFVAQIGDAT